MNEENQSIPPQDAARNAEGQFQIRPPLRQTHTYTVLEVAAATFADICKRLEDVNMLSEYREYDREGAMLIMFGTVALKSEVRGQKSEVSAPGIGVDAELIPQCLEVFRSEGRARISLLQRRLRLGYGLAARLMDELERLGYVGPAQGVADREIFPDKFPKGLA